MPNSSPGFSLRVRVGDYRVVYEVHDDRLLVQVPRSEGERKSKSGILIPATAEIPRRLSWAEVVAAERVTDSTGLYL